MRSAFPWTSGHGCRLTGDVSTVTGVSPTGVGAGLSEAYIDDGGVAWQATGPECVASEGSPP